MPGGTTPDGKEATKSEKDKKPAKEPEVWKRDHGRPTFARVYVGDGNSLELVSLHVSVTVEGPRARTLVDHVFRNPHGRQLEGTFEYPMPTGASPSYFAMFLGQTRDTVPPRFRSQGETPALPPDALNRLTPDQLVKHVDTHDWGRLQEARVVGKEKALEAYEETVRGRIDPALLEYAGGNTFRGRVFPIPAKGYNRVLIAYEELLPVVGDKVLYRFPLADCKLTELHFNLNARTAGAKDAALRPDGAEKVEGSGQLAYRRTWKDKGPGGEAQFAFTPAQPTVQAISGRQNENGPLYVYARIRPELKAEQAQPFAEHAVFLLDTSQSEHPDRFAAGMKLLKQILESDAALKHFNILTFDVAARWVKPNGWLPNTPAGREQALDRFDGAVLEGATDLSAALDKLAKPVFAVSAGTPVNVFLLSDGNITWGEPSADAVMARFEGRCPFSTRFHCYRFGIGADNLELFEALTRRGGGVFNCFTEEELKSAALAHRNQCLQVEKVRFVSGPNASDVLVAGRKAAVYPGGELIVAARMSQPGRTQVVVEGTFLGQKWVQEYPVEVATSSELAARGFGEVAVASLLALNDPKLDEVITAYCQQFSVGSRLASFLILENEADFKRLNLEAERGKTIAGDLGSFLEKAWKSLGQPEMPREAVHRLLTRVAARLKIPGPGDKDSPLGQLLALMTDADFEPPPASLESALPRQADLPPAYLKTRDADRANGAVYVTEARRRVDAKDVPGAVRVLSSVIEEHPGRTDALRLVGYRLLDLGQPAPAVQLFRQVQRQRPFEPHSYLDLARSLEQSGKYALAALQYEVVLAGSWHNRFRDSLKEVAQEDYTRMMRQAAGEKRLSRELTDYFGNRLEKVEPSKLQSDLRVSISWNTDATDVDLWVIEPDGTKCFYSHTKTKNGGELSQDMTQGYGPERYHMKKAQPGTYRVVVHYFNQNPNLLAGETHVTVTIARNAGSPQEQVERRTVILRNAKEEVEVTRVKF